MGAAITEPGCLQPLPGREAKTQYFGWLCHALTPLGRMDGEVDTQSPGACNLTQTAGRQRAVLFSGMGLGFLLICCLTAQEMHLYQTPLTHRALGQGRLDQSHKSSLAFL